MKKYKSIFKYIFILFTAFILSACVHDDKYDAPNVDDFQCGELTSNISIKDVKNLPLNTTITEDLIVEGYVSSADNTGNVYKYIYLQDDPVSPTQGLVLSVNSVSNYTKFAQGTKLYVKLKGLAIGTYGGVKQVGAMGVTGFDRVPEELVDNSLLRSCQEKVIIKPVIMKISDMKASNSAAIDPLIGALIQINNVEFESKSLCTIFAPNGLTVDRTIGEGWDSVNKKYLATAVVRNSGYASFANKMVPSGNGTFVGIFSKFVANSGTTTYQMYIVSDANLDMEGDKNNDGVDEHFPRLDGITGNPCKFNTTGLTPKTIAEVKQLFNSAGNYTQISGDFYVKATVTANDESGNLLNSLYIEDVTGGLRVNINKPNFNSTLSLLYQDPRFKVGKNLIIKLKDLYIGQYNGEFQIGMPNNTNIGYITEANVYKHFFGTDESVALKPTEKKISDFTMDDVGKWVKIKDVQVSENDLFKVYAAGGTTNRVLEDCSGNKITLRTRHYASFAGEEMDAGKGDIYAILSVFNGTYQLLLPFQKNADFDNARCDGTIPIVYETIYTDGFDTLDNWTSENISGTQVWTTTNFGNPRPSAFMDGNRQANEDWLISKKVSLSGLKDAYLSFETDGRYNGNPLEVYVTDNYTGSATTTSWTKMNAVFDQDLAGYAGFVGSGRVNLNTFLNKEIVVAFKYTSVAGASTSWEVDNFTVKGSK